MIVRGSSRPGGTPPGEDRWTRTRSGVIVLDGATSVVADVPAAGAYVDALLRVLAGTIDGPVDIGTLLADAIAVVTAELDLTPGTAPSSTVAVLRECDDSVEAAVIGDSTIVLGFTDGTEERLTDARMARVAAETRTTIAARLRGGSGYDGRHRELLRTVQAAERNARNTSGGYWIAEADDRAGHHAVVRRYTRGTAVWAVLATDGAQRGLDHHGIPWAALLGDTDGRLGERLDELHRWESRTDPDGRMLVRSKRHDDKTVVTWTPGPVSRRPACAHGVTPG